jgi:hypothetical protein
MEIKVYNKRGKKNYKEVRLIDELKVELEKRLENDHTLAHNFKPANTYEELVQLHTQYLSKDAEYEEIKETKSNSDNMAKKQSIDIEDDIEIDDNMDDSSFIDPFNRQEPTTYDYTNEGGFSKESTPKNTGQLDFAEPTSFNEAFELPEEGVDDEPVENNATQKQKETKSKETKQKHVKEDPWNSSFDDMSSGNQKKSTKKFAKYIVEAVCALAEKGFVWYANKDINESKLAEYELNGEINLSILVTLENGQDATVKTFFQQQCLAAEQLAKFEDEEKKDLSEALYAVMLEKGVAPTPTQELMIVLGGILVKKGAILLSLKSQTSSLLNQLKAMNQPQQQAPYQEPQPQQQAQYQEPQYQQTEPEYQQELQNTLTSDADMLDIDMVIETKE